MSALPAAHDERLSLATGLKDAMRCLASSVAIVTSRDADGQPHGMAASAVIPVSLDPPSMLVAINRGTGLHPVLCASGRYCISLLADEQHLELTPFSQSAQRDQRFRSDDWRDAWASEDDSLPWLDGASAVIECEVETSLDYGTHTVFIGRVVKVRCPSHPATAIAPLVWLGGRRASITPVA